MHVVSHKCKPHGNEPFREMFLLLNRDSEHVNIIIVNENNDMEVSNRGNEIILFRGRVEYVCLIRYKE